MKEITLQELDKLYDQTYVLLDIRDEDLRAYGMIPGAIPFDINADPEGINSQMAAIPEKKILVLYCEIGRRTRETDETAFPADREYFSLKGGYIGYVRSLTADKEAYGNKQKTAEDSIQKRFHKQLFTPFAKACKTYKLIEEGVAVLKKMEGKIAARIPCSWQSFFRKYKSTESVILN